MFDLFYLPTYLQDRHLARISSSFRDKDPQDLLQRFQGHQVVLHPYRTITKPDLQELKDFVLLVIEVLISYRNQLLGRMYKQTWKLGKTQ